ncbi:ABC transporter substrate-binding protein [Salmonella enterica]|nr:ABC transporter substrate-binding protein [Salmonella enterica]
MNEKSLTRRFLLKGMVATILSSSVPLNRVKAYGNVYNINIVDIAKRNVKIKIPINRLLVGDGALAYVLPLLNYPFNNVVGWGENFRSADLNGYSAYLEKFPDISKIPTFPATTMEVMNAEKIISLKPDLILMNLSSLSSVQSSGLMEITDKVGIPVIFVDFRTHIFSNTVRSMKILSKLFGCEKKTDAFLKFREVQIDRVMNKLKDIKYRPLVMIERAAGLYADCCMSYGAGNFGEIVSMAGGINMGSSFLLSEFGEVNPEQVVTSDPDVVIVTGANWSLYAPKGKWINLGPGADRNESLASLQSLMERPTYRSLSAVRNKRVHAIWHVFYDCPYNFIALQCIAKWLHPALFQDLEPEKTFRELYQLFLPIDYQSGYWISLK